MPQDGDLGQKGITATVTLCCQFDSQHYDFRDLKRAIRDAVERADEKEKRFRIAFNPLDEGITSTRIPHQIEEGIRDAAIVILEISDLNPNVIYELGLASGEKKPMILLREDGAKDVQFPCEPSSCGSDRSRICKEPGSHVTSRACPRHGPIFRPLRKSARGPGEHRGC